MFKVDNIQVLRAIAALLVAFGHFEGMAHAKMSYVRTAIPTGSGVDLFFIVSGFVMFLTSAKFEGHGGKGALDFFVRRLIRIVPLYWACTVLLLAVNLVSAHSQFTFGHIAASLLFIPFDSVGQGNGVYFPVLDLGWTLNYEMYFYVLFGLALLFGNVKLLVGATGLLLASVAFGFLIPTGAVQPYFWTRPIILEFAIGMFIARMFLAGIRLPVPVAMVGTLIAVALIATNCTAIFISSQDGTTLNDFGRVVAWGLPMGILFAAIVLMRTKETMLRLIKPLTAIGDASFSLYLLHPFVLIFLWQVWLRIPVAQQYPGVYVVVGLVLSVILSLLSFRYFEKPSSKILTLALRRRVELNA